MYEDYTVTVTLTVTATSGADALTAVEGAIGDFNYLAIQGKPKAEFVAPGTNRSPRRINLTEAVKVRKAER
jgi:hypothetical protein